MLSSPNRLKKEKDFASVLKYGRSFFGSHLKIKIRPNNLSVSRFGFILGLKLSKKATVRNRLRRQLSEIVRLEIKEEKIRPGFDGVFFMQPEILKLNYQELEKETVSLLIKANLKLNI